jgi:predicted RNase H-like nuclease (RuvC/YqgF family)
MTNEFKDYYKTVHEHANDMVNEIYDDLVSEMEDYSTLTLNTFLSWKESFLSEYNNYMNISLREAVEILEQSNRLCNDSAMYVGAGDCREQVQAMAYWTYRNDLMAEFRIALKERLENELPSYEKDVEELEGMIEELETQIENKEEEIEQLEEEKDIALEEEKPKTVKVIEDSILRIEKEIEDLKTQKEKAEEDLEKPQNLFENTESIIGEF